MGLPEAVDGHPVAAVAHGLRDGGAAGTGGDEQREIGGDGQQLPAGAARVGRRCSDPGVGDPAAALGKQDELLGAVAAQARPSGVVEVVAHPPAPAQRCRLHLEHVAGEVVAGKVAKQFCNHLALQLAAVCGLDVLEVAPPAASGDRAGRGDPVQARPLHRNDVGSCEPLADLGDPHVHQLAGEGVPDEDHPALVPGDEVSAVGDLPDLETGQQLALDGRSGHRSFSRSSLCTPMRT